MLRIASGVRAVRARGSQTVISGMKASRPVIARYYGSTSLEGDGKQDKDKQKLSDQSGSPNGKTSAELDEELRRKMEGISGDGGEAGVEYEDGQPVAMKRSVKSNMFRLI